MLKTDIENNKKYIMNG